MDPISLQPNTPVSPVQADQVPDVANIPTVATPIATSTATPPTTPTPNATPKRSASMTLEEELHELRQKLESAQVPEELKFQVERDLNRLERSGANIGYDEKYERLSKYLDLVVNLPWNKKSADVLDLEKTKEIFEKHHYGMQDVKDRFLEYVSVLKMRSQTQKNPYVKAPILLLVGLVGTGKTTFAYSLAEAMGRQLVRIPFGGMGSARDLRGQSRLHLEAEPGYVIKGLRQAGTRNPVILLDEIDRVADDARNDIMGVLVELLDPGQNFAFTDHYLDYPFDLSEVIFLATANNTRNIATAVFDRLEQISMPSYTDEQKIVIAQRYILPQLLEEAGLTPQQFIIQDPNLWIRLVRPLGYDAGIRTLQRTLQGAVRKSAREIVEKHVPQVVITEQNINLFLPQY